VIRREIGQNKSKQASQIADFGAAYHEENKLEKMIIIKQPFMVH